MCVCVFSQMHILCSLVNASKQLYFIFIGRTCLFLYVWGVCECAQKLKLSLVHILYYRVQFRLPLKLFSTIFPIIRYTVRHSHPSAHACIPPYIYNTRIFFFKYKTYIAYVRFTLFRMDDIRATASGIFILFAFTLKPCIRLLFSRRFTTWIVLRLFHFFVVVGVVVADVVYEWLRC